MIKALFYSLLVCAHRCQYVCDEIAVDSLWGGLSSFLAAG